MLDHYQARLDALTAAGFLHVKTDSPLTVVSIGCGDNPIELPSLSSRFPEMQYFGIDIERSPSWDALQTDTTKFQAMDATNTQAICDFVGTKADIVVFRHPVFSEKCPAHIAFQAIFIKTLSKLMKENGRLIISCYYPEEFEACNTLLGLLSQGACLTLPEDVSAPLTMETMHIPSIGNVERQLYADRFMLGCEFVPTLALQALSIDVPSEYYSASDQTASHSVGFFKRCWHGMDYSGLGNIVTFKRVKSTAFQETLLSAGSFEEKTAAFIAFITKAYSETRLDSASLPTAIHQVIFSISKGSQEERSAAIARMARVTEAVLYLSLTRKIEITHCLEQVCHAIILNNRVYEHEQLTKKTLETAYEPPSTFSKVHGHYSF